MTSHLCEKLCGINARMAELLKAARKPLDGRGEFGPEQIRLIRGLLDEMQPLVDDSAKVRREHPEIAEQFDLYKSQLGELLSTVQRVHMMFLVRRSKVDASRVHVEAVSQWANALSSTR